MSETDMKTFLLIAAAAGAVFAAAPAMARDGCGPGGHRGEYGHCRPNEYRRGPVLIAPGLVIGNYYGRRGWWDGNRYYQHRDHWHGGWRYR